MFYMFCYFFANPFLDFLRRRQPVRKQPRQEGVDRATERPAPGVLEFHIQERGNPLRQAAVGMHLAIDLHFASGIDQWVNFFCVSGF